MKSSMGRLLEQNHELLELVDRLKREIRALKSGSTKTDRSVKKVLFPSYLRAPGGSA